MSETTPQEPAPLSESEIIASRRAKLKRFRDELGFEPYGQREDGLLSLADARACFGEDAHVAYETAAKESKAAGSRAAWCSTATWASSCSSSCATRPATSR